MHGSPSPYGNQPASFAPHASSSLAIGQEKLAFLRKVYALFLGGVVSATIGAQVALYAGEESARMQVPGLSHSVVLPPVVGFFIQHSLVTMIAWFAIAFGTRAVQNVPGVNIAAMFGFTFFSGLFISPMLFFANLMAAQGHTVTANPVRDAFMLTSLAFTGLTVFVFVSKKDFSFLGGFLTMGLFVLLGAMVLGMFFGGEALQLAIASIGVLIFSGFILYDTSRILRSDERENPVGAAISLYMNVLNLFLFVLRLFMQRRSGD
jgi:modulator of FtsH protease